MDVRGVVVVKGGGPSTLLGRHDRRTCPWKYGWVVETGCHGRHGLSSVGDGRLLLNLAVG